MYNELATKLKIFLIFPSFFCSRPSSGETEDTWEDQEHLQDEEEKALMDLNLNSS